MRAKEHSRVPISPVYLGCSGRELLTPHHPVQDPGGPAQPHPHRSGCWAPAGSLAHTGSGRSRASSRSGAGSSGSGTRLCLGWRQGKEGRGQRSGGPRPAATQGFATHSLVCVWGLDWARSARTHTYTRAVLSLVTEVAGAWGEAWGWVEMGISARVRARPGAQSRN